MNPLRLTSAVLSLSVILLTVGCTQDGEVNESAFEANERITVPESLDSFGVTLPDVHEETSYTFGSIPVCLAKGDAADISTVTAAANSSIRVVGFAVSRDTMSEAFGSDEVDLRQAGFDPQMTTVTSPCVTPDELAIEVQRAGPDTASSEHFVVKWGTAGSSHELTIPFTLVLCSPSDSTTEYC